jgi:hypothetical protein
MALTISDRIKETSSTTGTGTYTLAGAVTGFETFTANLSNSDTTYYCCTDNTDFEVGLGTFTTSGTTLARTTILASSNSNNAVSWGAGTRTVFCTLPAAKTIILDASGNTTIGGVVTIGSQLIMPDVTSAKILVADGTSYQEVAVSGDVTIANTGAVTIGSGVVETSMIAADAVTGAKIADDAIDSEHYADGSIDTAHIANLQITTGLIAADAITAAKIADDVIDSEHYAAGSIDTEHIADAQITVAKMAANSVDSDQYVDGSIDTVHIADVQVTTAKIAADAITEAKIADAAVESEHLNNNVISGQTELASGLALTDELFVSDAGTLKRMDVSVLTTLTDDNATALAITLG